MPYSEILVNGERVGSAGVLPYQVVGVLDIKADRVCSAELDFDKLLELYSEQVKMKPLPKFPAIVRDLSLIVDEQVRWADIIEAVNRKASAELEQTCFVGIYRGGVIPAGKKSVTLSLKFRDKDGTLTHDVVDRLEANIVAELAKSVGAELRTV